MIMLFARLRRRFARVRPCAAPAVARPAVRHRASPPPLPPAQPRVTALDDRRDPVAESEIERPYFAEHRAFAERQHRGLEALAALSAPTPMGVAA